MDWYEEGDCSGVLPCGCVVAAAARAGSRSLANPVRSTPNPAPRARRSPDRAAAVAALQRLMLALTRLQKVDERATFEALDQVGVTRRLEALHSLKRCGACAA